MQFTCTSQRLSSCTLKTVFSLKWRSIFWVNKSYLLEADYGLNSHDSTVRIIQLVSQWYNRNAGLKVTVGQCGALDLVWLARCRNALESVANQNI